MRSWPEPGPVSRTRRPAPLPALLAFAAALLQGCAQLAGPPVEHDPWERFNRTSYAFNDSLDRNLLKPAAEIYDAWIPEFLDRGISNFFSNLDDLVVTVNDLLQLKGRQFLSDGGRFLINTTLGVYGLFDVASAVGLPKHDEDFGQTLGYWGVPSGPYLVIPFLGPSTLRDGPAKLVDGQYDPMFALDAAAGTDAYYGAFVVRAIDTRAQLLGASSILDTAALDPYAFTRDAWLQRRQSLVRNGDREPPPDALDELDEPPGGQPDELDLLDQLELLEEPSGPPGQP